MNKRVLVTGSSRGIGKAIALRLAKEGYHIAIHCKNNQEAASETLETIEALGSNGVILQFDIADPEQSRIALEQDLERNGVYFGIICNAGISADAPFPGMSLEAWTSVIQTDLNSFYNVLHPVVMPMVSSRMKGRIISLSSISGIVGNRGQVNYSAAKAGLIGASKALSRELAKRGITVNCIAPGIIETEMTHELALDEIKRMIPMRRLGKPEEVAGVAAFLMSDDAAYITGEVISVSGGMI